MSAADLHFKALQDLNAEQKQNRKSARKNPLKAQHRNGHQAGDYLIESLCSLPEGADASPVVEAWLHQIGETLSETAAYKRGGYASGLSASLSDVLLRGMWLDEDKWDGEPFPSAAFGEGWTYGQNLLNVTCPYPLGSDVSPIIEGWLRAMAGRWDESAAFAPGGYFSGVAHGLSSVLLLGVGADDDDDVEPDAAGRAEQAGSLLAENLLDGLANAKDVGAEFGALRAFFLDMQELQNEGWPEDVANGASVMLRERLKAGSAALRCRACAAIKA